MWEANAVLAFVGLVALGVAAWAVRDLVRCIREARDDTRDDRRG